MRRIVSLLLLLFGAVGAIYPDDHWNHVTQITSEEVFEKTVQNEIDAGRTLFAPSWNEITKAFAGNDDVSFADINLSEVPIRGPPYNPGQGGWPTIRYFNKDTGPDGAPYEKKTPKAMCEELGDRSLMTDYVEEAGNTSLCKIDGTNCDDKAKSYIDKMKKQTVEDQKKQYERLMGMEANSMAPDLKNWLKQRKKILKQLLAESMSDEL